IFQYLPYEIYVKTNQDQSALKEYFELDALLDTEKVVLDQTIELLEQADAKYKAEGKSFYVIEQPYERTIAVDNLVNDIKKIFYGETVRYQRYDAEELAKPPILRTVKLILEEIKT